MTNVLAENSGAQQIALATPIKLIGVLDLEIKLGIFLNTPMGLKMVFVNTNDCGNYTWH